MLPRQASGARTRKQLIEQSQLHAHLRTFVRIQTRKAVTAIEQPERRMVAQGAVRFELLFAEHLIDCGFVREPGIAFSIVEHVVVLVTRQ